MMRTCKHCGASIVRRDFHVDLDCNMIIVDGVAVKVPPSQAELAEVLARAYPRPATFESLLNGVYGCSDSSPETLSTIRVFSYHLRRSLQNTRLRLRNVHSRGYRFELEDIKGALNRSGDPHVGCRAEH